MVAPRKRDAEQGDCQQAPLVGTFDYEQTKDKELSDSEIDSLKSQEEKLMNDAQALFAKMYENVQGAAGAQGAGPDMGAGAGPDMNAGSTASNDDNVVDGDYREV